MGKKKEKKFESDNLKECKNDRFKTLINPTNEFEKKVL